MSTNYSVYWRPLLTQENKLEPVCMQSFDEDDYEHNRYFNDIKYFSEEECQKLCDTVIIDLLEKNKTVSELAELGLSANGIRIYWKKYFEDPDNVEMNTTTDSD